MEWVRLRERKTQSSPTHWWLLSNRCPWTLVTIFQHEIRRLISPPTRKNSKLLHFVLSTLICTKNNLYYQQLEMNSFFIEKKNILKKVRVEGGGCEGRRYFRRASTSARCGTRIRPATFGPQYLISRLLYKYTYL